MLERKQIFDELSKLQSAQAFDDDQTKHDLSSTIHQQSLVRKALHANASNADVVGARVRKELYDAIDHSESTMKVLPGD